MQLSLATAVFLFVTLASAQETGTMLEWPYVGVEQEQTKYSAAEAITTANVGDLEIAWKGEPNEKPLGAYGTRPGPFQTTPVMVGNV